MPKRNYQVLGIYEGKEGQKGEEMSKMTKKFELAVHRLNIMGVKRAHELDNDEAYERLKEAGYWWDSKLGEWIKLDSVPAEPASPVVRIRVWAEKGKATMISEGVADSMADLGYAMVDRSEAYPCRPPKQLEERVYLTFAKQASRDQEAGRELAALSRQSNLRLKKQFIEEKE